MTRIKLPSFIGRRRREPEAKPEAVDARATEERLIGALLRRWKLRDSQLILVLFVVYIELLPALYIFLLSNYIFDNKADFDSFFISDLCRRAVDNNEENICIFLKTAIFHCFLHSQHQNN